MMVHYHRPATKAWRLHHTHTHIHQGVTRLYLSCLGTTVTAIAHPHHRKVCESWSWCLELLDSQAAGVSRFVPGIGHGVQEGQPLAKVYRSYCTNTCVCWG